MTTPNLPGAGIPDGAYQANTAKGLQDVDENSAKNSLKTPVIAPFQGLGGLFSMVLQGIATGITGALAELSDLFSLRWDQVDTIENDLGSLQDRTQTLEGVIGFAHANSSSDLSLSLDEQARPMDIQIGPVVGVQLTGGQFVLQSRGLWVADVHQTFAGYPFGAADIWVGIRVYTPGGVKYADRYSHATTSAVSTLSVHMPFTVPGAGYKVQAWVHAALGRGIWGGAGNNGLSVYKESSETS